MLRIRHTGIPTVNYGILERQLALSDGDARYWQDELSAIVFQVDIMDIFSFLNESLVDATECNIGIVWFSKVQLQAIHVFVDDFVAYEGADEVVVRV